METYVRVLEFIRFRVVSGGHKDLYGVLASKEPGQKERSFVPIGGVVEFDAQRIKELAQLGLGPDDFSKTPDNLYELQFVMDDAQLPTLYKMLLRPSWVAAEAGTKLLQAFCSIASETSMAGSHTLEHVGVNKTNLPNIKKNGKEMAAIELAIIFDLTITEREVLRGLYPSRNWELYFASPVEIRRNQTGSNPRTKIASTCQRFLSPSQSLR
jgi:hypothetical protein